MRLRRQVLILCFVLALHLGLARAVATVDWPEGYVVHEDSESPDGEYGIIVPGDESTVAEGDNVNYLAKAKTRQVLGKIEGSDYFEHQNHRLLDAKWSPDSKWCVATYWDRY